MPLVDARNTPIAPLGLARVLSEGHERAFGSRPCLSKLGVAWAHVSLETGQGAKMWCYNFGNQTCYAAPGLDWYEKTAPEYIGGKKVVKTLKYRAYASAEAGAEAYWNLLAGHYAPALGRMASGDPGGAAEALGAARYYTASAEVYRRVMCELFAEFNARYAPLALAPPALSDPGASLVTDADLASIRSSSSSLSTACTLEMPAVRITDPGL